MLYNIFTNFMAFFLIGIQQRYYSRNYLYYYISGIMTFCIKKSKNKKKTKNTHTYKKKTNKKTVVKKRKQFLDTILAQHLIF